ncbi:PREDICTED: 7-deoxyloganetic acid glucosyltransferase-like [Ipomoea nil]|uniref:7-deoxyloganetic acid glucosyltransferase-like n=1 Tax=Ipomoea nil TaxID=35883 RepID=UPI0009008829|nr:PREDICTED: 7-deoxyloganetic acid glucosyltransferase-like [Ipomoea nil]
MDNGENAVPNVIIFPLPLQSPVNSMLKLAELLCLAGGVHVTFLITEHNHQRLLRSTDAGSRFERYYLGKFSFEVISDGLREDHPRSAEDYEGIVNSLQGVAEPHLREMLRSERGRKVTCVIAEAVFGYAFEIGKEVGIPVFAFETVSPCYLGVYLCIPKLFEEGQLPSKGEDLETLVTGVPGMEGLLKVRDLPHFCRAKDPWAEESGKLIMAEIHAVPKAHGLILNSFEELDGPIMAHIRTHCPNTYMIGPVQQHLKTRLAERETTMPPSSNSFWREDKTCIQWLDEQPEESVIYVSFGSQNTLTMAELMEVWHGLVASGVRFLWVLRPNTLRAAKEVLDQNLVRELKKGCLECGRIVSWAPQEEVLAHRAIGGFWTHSGWNSTLESILAGKPMICWAQYVDQLVTRRLVSEVWRIGVDMEDRCDRLSVEKMVKELMMGSRRQELKKSAQKFSKLARESVNNGGSSYTSLDHLINDIRKLSSIKHFQNNLSCIG